MGERFVHGEQKRYFYSCAVRCTSSYTLDTELRFAGDVEHNPITSGFCYPGRAALRGPFINQMIYSCLMKDWWRYTD